MTRSKPAWSLALLLLLPSPEVPAQDPGGSWSPLALDGGAALVYQWTMEAGGTELRFDLSIEFIERLDGQRDAVMMLDDEPATRVMEEGIQQIPVWVISEARQLNPATLNEKLALAGTIQLLWPFMSLTLPLAGNETRWQPGYSVEHPSLPGNRITVEGTSCSEAGLRGRVVRGRGPQGDAEACVSSGSSFPLRFRSFTSATGETHTFVLVSQETSKHDPPPTFHRGEPKGFREIDWGAELASVGMSSDNCVEEQGMTICQRLDDNLSLEDVPLESLRYHFLEGRFLRVRGTFRGADNWEKLKNAFLLRYGRASKELDRERYRWSNDQVANVVLDFSPRAGEGSFTIGSVELERESRWKALNDLFSVEE